jgi:3-hydroxyisobutyrate dehydrogenase-like beta-hydroxyacid dehydrogenase
VSAAASRPAVGFIGLGTMGRGMARRLVAAGLAVKVFDVNEAAVADLVAAGATAGGSLAELGATCDVLMIAVVNDEQVRQVAGAPGETGLLATARPGTVMLIHSTIPPETCRELAGSAASAGITVLDAPMTGNEHAAAAGQLSVMVGGEPAGLEAARPAVETFATRITHLGPAGSGQLAKIANNLAIAITMRAAREALQLAEAFGISSDAMLPLLASGGADSWVVRSWRTIGESAETYPGGAAGLGSLTYKDVSLALGLARQAGIEIPTGALASQLLDDAYIAAHEDALRHRQETLADRPRRPQEPFPLPRRQEDP